MFARMLAPAATLALALLTGPLAGADAPPLTVAGVFGDGAVLQRDMPIPVWGRGTPGAGVVVRFGPAEATATVGANGAWKATLAPLPASDQGRMLVAESAGERVERTDLLVGDVWVLAGQTNMACPLAECDGGRLAARRANHPWLRAFHNADEPCDKPARDTCPGSYWATCTPGTASQMSGVGYYFAEALHRFTKAPVGLLMTAAPGAGIECWARPGLFDADARLGTALDDYREALALYPARRLEWDRRRAAFERRAEAAEVAGLPLPTEPVDLRVGPLGPTHPLRPHALYHGRVCPLMPFAVRGVVWYEGEASAKLERNPIYDRLLPALIRDWRRGWRRPDLPFVLVQLPRYEPGMLCDYARVREAQAAAAAEVGNCALAVTIDCGDPDDPCPGDKKPVGERAALAARRVAYRDLSAPMAPTVASVERSGASLIVRFRETGRGLELRVGDGASGFEVREGFGPFRPASAEVIAPDAVRLSHPELAAPSVARYAWGGNPAVTLFVRDGLPAAPFRAAAGR